MAANKLSGWALEDTSVYEWPLLAADSIGGRNTLT